MELFDLGFMVSIRQVEFICESNCSTNVSQKVPKG